MDVVSSLVQALQSYLKLLAVMLRFIGLLLLTQIPMHIDYECI